jgi:multimeric flavodoxin WrbA
MNVVAFNGSARKNGNTAILLKTALAELEREGIRTELIQLAGLTLSGCDACYTCREKKDGRCVIDTDPVNEYIEKILTADGILLGSPVYFGDITTNTKALMERAGLVVRVNGDLLKRKVGAGVVAVRRGGAMHALNSLNHLFTISQMIVVGSSYWNIGIGREASQVEQDDEGMRTMRTLGQNMAWLLKKLHA